MRRCLGILLAVGLLCLAADAAADAVRGYVVLPATDDRATDVEVAFALSGENGLDELRRKRVDGEGRFEFAGPFLKSGLDFVLIAYYRGVPHPSGKLELGAQKEIVLEVFEPTGDDSDIRIASHHTFLIVADDHLQVAQLLHVENGGETTFIGSGDGERRHVMELPVPDGAFGLQSHFGDIVRESANLAFGTRPLAPGTTQAGLSYQLAAADFAGEYTHEVSYPTDLLEIYVHPPDIHLHRPFVDRGVVSLQDRQYHLYDLEGLLPGQSITIPLPLSLPLRWVVKWAGVGLLVTAAGAVLVLSARRQSAAPIAETARADGVVIAAVDPGIDATATRTQLERRRRVLLEQLAALDGGDSRKRHAKRHKRQHLLDQTVAVYRLLDKATDG